MIKCAIHKRCILSDYYWRWILIISIVYTLPILHNKGFDKRCYIVLYVIGLFVHNIHTVNGSKEKLQMGYYIVFTCHKSAGVLQMIGEWKSQGWVQIVFYGKK